MPKDAPARTRAYAQELSERNAAAINHYFRCKAVLWRVPETTDPIVQRNAAIIREIEEILETKPMTELTHAIRMMGVAGR